MDNYQEDENQPLVQKKQQQQDKKQEQVLTIGDKRKRQAVKLISRQQKSQINQDKQRAIQGFIVVLITLLFCFSGLLLLHIHDKEHTKLKKFNFLETEEHIQIIKPELDKNDYKYYKMKNGLKVLLVSDPQAWQATAAIDVQSGSLNNPEEYQGLAHFLEHMMFLQSNMPSIDDYLGKNGGFSNAYTSSINTNYYMDCYGYALEDGLQLFSQMFYDFEIEQEALEKEISAVNGEYEQNISNDSWKIQNLISIISKESHPESQFSTGNRDSLIKDGIKDALKKYFDDHYSANNMSLVVTSYQSIEELEEMVKKADFQKIENKNLETYHYETNPISEEYLGGLIRLNWESDTTQLVVLTQLDGLATKKNSKDLDFIFYSLFHTEKDSLIDILKGEELVVDVGHGSLSDNNDYNVYATIFQLTKKGQENYDDIINLYYTSLQKMLDEGIDQEIYEERKQLSDIEFKFLNLSGDTSDLASDLAFELNQIGPEYVLYGYYYYPEFKEDNIISLVEQLKDSSNSVYVIQKNFESQENQETAEQDNLQEESSSFVSLQKKKHIKNKSEKKTKKHQNVTSQKQKSTEKHAEHQEKQLNAKKSVKPLPRTKQEKQHKKKSLEKQQKNDNKKKSTTTTTETTGKISSNVPEKQNIYQKNPRIVNGLKSKQINFTLSYDHKNFLAQNQLQNDNELHNVKWDFEAITDDEISEVNELNVDLYDRITLVTPNKFVPKNLSMISLCTDTDDSAMDLGYQLANLLNDKSSVQDDNNDDNDENGKQFLEILGDNEDLLKSCDLFSSGTKRYHQFMFKEFDATQYDTIEQCQAKEVQYEKKNKYPQLLIEDVRGKLFYQLDRSFATPKNIVMSTFTSNKLPVNARTTASLSILNYSLQNKIEKEFAKQIEAGYELYVTTSNQGLSIYVEGWSEHFSEVAAKTFATLSELNVTEKDLRQAKEIFLNQLNDSKNINPLDQAMQVKLPLLLQKPYVKTENMIKAVENIEIEYINNMKKELLSQVKLNTLVFGNISEQETKMLYETVTNLFPGAQNEVDDSYEINQISNIENKNLLIREFTEGPADELNSATLNYYQAGQRTLQSSISLDLINDYAFSFFYTYLRTDRELGYSAAATPSPFSCVDGYSIYVFGSKEAPHIVDGIIEESLKDFYKELKKIDAKEYSDMQGSSYSSYDIEFSDMYEKATYYFSFIQAGDYFFDELKQKQVYVEKVTKKDVLDFYRETFLENPGKLSVQIYSKTGNVEYPSDLKEKDSELAQNSTLFTEVANDKKYEFVTDDNQLHSVQDYTCAYDISYE